MQMQPRNKAKAYSLRQDSITVCTLAEHLNVDPQRVQALAQLLNDTPITAHTSDVSLSVEEAELIADELKVLNKLSIQRIGEVQMLRRRPVVAIMGHVDHGKTTLLDTLRTTSVGANEVGGITQKLAAFEVLSPRSALPITFLDTPGHAAFTTMRHRSVDVADIIVLVIAVEDGIMPQTREIVEFVKHCNAAVVVAINKIDKSNFEIDSILLELDEAGITPKQLGGDTPVVPISALKNQNIDTLEETIIETAEKLKLDIDSSAPGSAYVLESRVSLETGRMLTTIIRNGIFSIGDHVVLKSSVGQISQITDLTGRSVRSTELFSVVDMRVRFVDKRHKDSIADTAGEMLYYKKNRHSAVAFAAIADRLARKSKEMADTEHSEASTNTCGIPFPQVAVVIKSRDQGSLDAVTEFINQKNMQFKRKWKSLGSQESTKNNYVRESDFDDLIVPKPINIIKSGIGPVSSSDIVAAVLSNSTLITFDVPVINEGVMDKTLIHREHLLIHEVFSDIEELLRFNFGPKKTIMERGVARVTNVGTYSIKGKIMPVLGCHVITGCLSIEDNYSIRRDGRFVTRGLKFRSIKYNNEFVQVLKTGCSGGVIFTGDKKQSVEAGDHVIAYDASPIAPLFGKFTAPNYLKTAG